MELLGHSSETKIVAVIVARILTSGGSGSPAHLAGELFKMMADIDIFHVPYRGAVPAHTDLLAGQAQVMFPGTVASIEYVRAGRLSALAVTAATRSEALP